MLSNQKQAFRLYCKEHKHLYRIFSQWFERRTNRALRENRRLWGIDNNLVVFSSYNMRSYNDNPHGLAVQGCRGGQGEVCDSRLCSLCGMEDAYVEFLSGACESHRGQLAEAGLAPAGAEPDIPLLAAP